MKNTTRILPGLLLAVLAFAMAGASAQSDEPVVIDIEPQQAGAALLALAESSGMQILFAKGASTQVEVEGLKGEYQFEEALAALLTDTGMEYEFASDSLVLVQPAAQAEEQDTREVVEEQDAEEQEAPLELGEQNVTGSRLATGDPSARVYSFTAEDIALRGVSSLEDFFRTLPWAFPTVTTQTNAFPVQTEQDYEKNFGVLAIGVSTINLRHMGSANTLVLVNGRRIAGLAGDIDNIVNLLNVPLSAIERVDVQLDGASAVYGADAIGGVVNFITRKNYRGASASYREESSSTDADRRHLSVRGGFGWGSGNVSASLSRDTSEPVNHLKLWTTLDWRPIFGPEFDRRYGHRGQPGVVCTYNGSVLYPGCAWPNANRRALPPDHSGVGATAEDFSADLASERFSLFWAQNGEDSTNTSLNLYLEQYLTDGLRVYADVLASRHDAYQARFSEMDNYVVPASNAYNPYGEHVVVNYVPWREIQAGIFEPSHTESENEQRNYSAGLFWEFGKGHQLEVSAGVSESVRSAWQVRYDYPRNFHDPSAHALYDALASPDPDKALNLFGDGTVQGSLAADLFSITNGPIRAFTDITRFEPLLRGQLFRLWGGPIDYAVGAEYRRFEIEEYSERYQDGVLQRNTYLTGLAYWYGVERPTLELRAGFFELALPFVGPANARPGLHSLILSIQARRDTYETEGAAGGRDWRDEIPEPDTINRYVPGEGWQPFPATLWSNPLTANIVEVKKGATSPRLGLHYKPIESFTLRTAWSRSFAPPAFNRMFSTSDERQGRFWARDPYHPDGDTGWFPFPHMERPFALYLNPEYSDNYSVSFDWSPEGLPGLRWMLDWSRVDFTDKVVDQYTLLWDARDVTFKLPEFVQRDADGYITSIVGGERNIAEKRSEIVHTQFEYAFDTRVGSFISSLNYTRVLEEYYRVTPESESLSSLGKLRGSNKYKLTGSLSWRRGRFGADMHVYYTPGYLNDRAGYCNFNGDGRCDELDGELPHLDVDALTTVDLTVSYRFDNGLRLRAGGRNVFLTESRTVWNHFQYDPTRWDARGRVLFLELNWEL